MTEMQRTEAKLQLLREISDEADRADAEHGSYNSAHEGYAVLIEEVDELWDEVRKKDLHRSKERMREECIQIAAVAMRFARDLT